jgi:CRISPR-associated protein Csx10
MAKTVHEVNAKALQGLAIGGPAEVGFDKATLRYIPGSTLRGALAAAWIAEHGLPKRQNPRRDEFVAVFEREIRFGPLFQVGSALVPLTAIWCKYPRTPDCATWSQDAAVVGPTALCPHCGQGVATGKGEIDGVSHTRVVRTALDEIGRAKNRTLRARHELTAGTEYHGRLTGWHEWLSSPREIFIGGMTSISGLTSLSIAPSAVRVPVPLSPRADGALVLRLRSPAIVVDDAGRPSLDLVPELLRILGLPSAAVDRGRTRQWTRPVKVGGWHAASGLPKPTEYAIAHGSVIVLAVDREFEGGIDDARLAELAAHGIGLRRIEGFGDIEINPPAWRPAVRAASPASTTEPTLPDPLAGLRVQGLLDKLETVSWLLDRGRRVLIERQNDRKYSPEPLLAERIALHFDDPQADAVRSLFSSPRLGAALPLLERERDRFRVAGRTGGAE